MKSSKGFKLFSWSLIFIVFICLVIALTNFAIIYKDCRDDVLKTSNAADTTAVAVEASVSLSGSMSGEKKCCNCSTSSSRDVEFSLTVLDEIHNIFDENLLTFLVSFSLIAVLTMLIHDSSELHKALTELESKKAELETSVSSIRSEYDQKRNDFNSMKEELEASVSSIRSEVEQRLTELNIIRENMLSVSSLSFESKLLVSIIESSEFIVNDTASTSISRLGIRLDDFSWEIPYYSQQLKDEAVFANEDIDSMLRPLYDVQQDIEDLYRAANRRNPDLVSDLEVQLSPVESSVDDLIRKIEGYRAAPKNQQA